MSVRLLVGMILGAALLAGGVYIRDTSLPAASAAPNVTRPIVNWDVVQESWNSASARAKEEWSRWTKT